MYLPTFIFKYTVFVFLCHLSLAAGINNTRMVDSSAICGLYMGLEFSFLICRGSLKLREIRVNGLI